MLWEFWLGHQGGLRAKSTLALIFLVIGFLAGYVFEIVLLNKGK